jgi:hypothetical protein
LGVVIVDASHKITVTPETKAFFMITDPSFTLEN